MPVPKDLSKIKTKLAFNLTKRQLVCFSGAAAVGLPTYLLSRGSIGNSAAMFLMIGLMLPFFFLAMYERDGLPLEKVLKNIIRTRFLYPRVRPYETENFYALLSARKEAQPIAKQKKGRNFLNTVTTDDLLPLAEQGKEPPKEVTPEPEPKPTEPVEEVPEPEPEKKDSPLLSLLLIGTVVLAGGGIGYYFKIYKPKHEAPDLEDDYCEYEDGELEEIAEEPEDEDTPPWEEDTEE